MSTWRTQPTEHNQEGLRNCLMNRVLPGLGGDTPLEDFTWGRTHLDGVGEQVGASSWTGRRRLRRNTVQSEKALMVLRQVFDYAIDQGGWRRPTGTKFQALQGETSGRAPSMY